MRHYNFNGQPITSTEATYIPFVDEIRRVSRTQVTVGDVTYTVSTVFLCLDHSFGGGVPIIYETMVFSSGEWDDLYCDRYATYEEAVEGHGRAVLKVMAGEVLPREDIEVL